MEKLLIVDDDRHIRGILAERFRKFGHETIEAGSGWSCLKHLENEQVTIVVLNEKLPDMDGFEVLEKIKELSAGLRVLFVLEQTDAQNRLRATQFGACEVLEKPLPLNRLLDALVACKAKNAGHPISVADLLQPPIKAKIA